MERRAMVVMQIVISILLLTVFGCEKAPKKQVRIPEVSVCHPIEQEVTR
ncbi:MAG: hypothetical protein ACP5M0_05515 [Desulfomonilaceae bacterium]